MNSFLRLGLACVVLSVSAARAADAPAAPPSDDASRIDDLQMKLSAALRSFTVVQDENAALRSQVDKLTADLATAQSQNAALKPQAAEASQLDSIRNQLRECQNEAARLAAENASLRTRLSLSSSDHSMEVKPSRPSEQPAAPAAEPAPAPAPERTYTVVEGDTLSGIAKKCYGTASRWQEILDANRDLIKDEKSLPIGAELKIP
jgi:LysM repeat protein